MPLFLEVSPVDSPELITRLISERYNIVAVFFFQVRNLFNRVIESFDGLIYYKFKFSVLFYTFALEANSMIGTT